MAVAVPLGGAVGDAAVGAEGRLASADVADVGFAAAAGRVAEAAEAVGLAARGGAAVAGAEPDPDADPGPDPDAELETSAGTDPDAEPETSAGTDPDADPDASAGTDPDADADCCADADPDAVDAEPVEVDPDAVFDARAWAGVEPVGVAPVLAGAADGRGAVPAGGVCATADFGAGADVFEAGGAASDNEGAAKGDFREPEVDVEDAAADDVAVEGAFAVEADAGADAALGVGVTGAAERVGGIGESPDPRSEASSTGDAQVPEYAASEGAAAHEPEVEIVAGAPEALEAVEPPEAIAPGAEFPSAAGTDLELEAFVAAAGEPAAAALEIFVAVVAELANTGPEAFAAVAA